MRIQNNLVAMNNHRQMGANQLGQKKTTEKLSSGNRVNRAADDAAGLSISEKMRSQVRGMNRSSANAQDAISLIQAAEGALQESHSILQRIRELAVQGANDINADEDRIAIKSEIDQLGMELDRIATTTNFNNKYILSGKYQSSDYWPDGNNNIPEELDSDDVLGRLNIQAGANTLGSDVIKIAFRGVTASDLLNGHLSTDGESSDRNWVEYDPERPLETGFVPNIFTFNPDGSGLAETVSENTKAPTHFGFKSLLNVLDNRCDYHNTKYGDPDITDNNEIGRPTGIALINLMRSELGSMQNRLESTIANTDTVSENLQAAESRIRDSDMAREMLDSVRHNILQQASTAMLAQANQIPQGVLSLLR